MQKCVREIYRLLEAVNRSSKHDGQMIIDLDLTVEIIIMLVGSRARGAKG